LGVFQRDEAIFLGGGFAVIVFSQVVGDGWGVDFFDLVSQEREVICSLVGTPRRGRGLLGKKKSIGVREKVFGRGRV